MMQTLAPLWTERRDIILVSLVVGILLVLFVPVPAVALDFLLVINISLALLVLLVTFFTESPLNFSTFPTLLLIATMFRLALNVSATRLILEGGDAGRVINAIGSFVVGGNYVVGIVVFLILVVVQYVVVTNGAQRVAEVAARFTLDSMPGKQMSIDADMNMGIIDERQAKARRAAVEREASFYGAMDGATKFIKGDAIAGIVIIFINIVGGLAIGIAQMGMPWREAVQRFTLLTIGDGIVTQISSLVVAVATGIIITRAASDARLGAEIPRQLLSSPRALLLVAAALLVILVLPGFPVFPVLTVMAVVGALLWFSLRSAARAGAEDLDKPDQSSSVEAEKASVLAQIEPVEVRLGADLSAALASVGSDFSERIQTLRRQIASELGFILPKVQVAPSPALPTNAYEIAVFGNRVGAGNLLVDRTLAINSAKSKIKLEGVAARDPAYGLPAVWIEDRMRPAAQAAGYTLADPDTVLITHLHEISKAQAAELLTRKATEQLCRTHSPASASLVEELVPQVLSFSDVQKTLQILLREQVSLRNLEAIIEVLLDVGRSTKSPEELAEKVRERLGAAICQRFLDARGELNVLTLAPDLERTLVANQRGEQWASLFTDMAQLDGFIRGLAQACEAMMTKGFLPVLLCPAPLRRALRTLIQRSVPYVAVVAVNEVPATLSVRSFAPIGASATGVLP
ncbi:MULTISPECIES: flagellar biosynthesis protein FlhA [Pseudoxanthomonas]|uniref:Flagellar biosynthesis protein FlhA n=1 Tax=Pseudoxanthomonas winnipegensis TaxID=2480810 RepID=A0AAW8GI09_9GAMM|nr:MULTISPECIES: flagellar biosynthesis protein FlhA [Pseudoxanthomonas]MDQ1120679.1 flagellar biosynthesis protein FlhA [Pseudoxanthomonas winnipegensis]MDQ1133902.1 flagellar biosynthesis protein FlhA [Pseudoxanthomonas winnipegensis]MDR6139862.1 flagellar biosynthesis protein FlhA [Pseudoxanthomonas sp. SORGH_AS_0997]